VASRQRRALFLSSKLFYGHALTQSKPPRKSKRQNRFVGQRPTILRIAKMKDRKPEIRALPGALDKPSLAPAWLPKFAKTEWARVVPPLVKARSLAQHELSTVEYCLSIVAVMSVGRAAANAIACFPTIPRRSFEIPVTNAN
jgi:hypothetical protein